MRAVARAIARTDAASVLPAVGNRLIQEFRFRAARTARRVHAGFDPPAAPPPTHSVRRSFRSLLVGAAATGGRKQKEQPQRSSSTTRCHAASSSQRKNVACQAACQGAPAFPGQCCGVTASSCCLLSRRSDNSKFLYLCRQFLQGRTHEIHRLACFEKYPRLPRCERSRRGIARRASEPPLWRATCP